MRDAAAIETFLEMMSAERGAAQNTLDSYRRDLEDAAAFSAATGVPLTQAQPGTIRSY
ncbi:MAG: site-specific integrase, partial [Phyllobacterium sp.]